MILFPGGVYCLTIKHAAASDPLLPNIDIDIPQIIEYRSGSGRLRYCDIISPPHVKSAVLCRIKRPKQ